MIQSVVDEIRKKIPYFQLKLILITSKLGGRQSLDQLLEKVKKHKDVVMYKELVAGFDLKHEEDFT